MEFQACSNFSITQYSINAAVDFLLLNIHMQLLLKSEALFGSRCFDRIILTLEKFWIELAGMKGTKTGKDFRKWAGLLMF